MYNVQTFCITFKSVFKHKFYMYYLICSWLFECAKSQVIVSTDDYLVRETTPSPPNNGCVSMGGASMREDSIIKTPLKSFCPNFDVEVGVALIRLLPLLIIIMIIECIT